MEITSQRLSDNMLYSHRNQEKILKSIINESANALFLESYDDVLILADQNSGQIYSCNYSFDGRTLQLENYEPVDIISEDSSLRRAVNDYFDDEMGDINLVKEAYEDAADSRNNELADSITRAISEKNLNNVIDYTQLAGINEEIGELANSRLFEAYRERIAEKPMGSLKLIDWVNPVAVSMIDEDYDYQFCSSGKETAKTLIKNKDIRAAFGEACEDLYNGDSYYMEDFLNEHNCILSLNESELKEFVGTSVIGKGDLMANRKAIVSMINETVENDFTLSSIKTVYEESEEDAGTEEGKDNEKLATSDKDLDDLAKALDKALEGISDEKLVNKIESLKKDIEDSKETGVTPVNTVKECVEILSF